MGAASLPPFEQSQKVTTILVDYYFSGPPGL